MLARLRGCPLGIITIGGSAGTGAITNGDDVLGMIDHQLLSTPRQSPRSCTGVLENPSKVCNGLSG